MFLSNKIYRGTLCTFFEKSTQKMLIEFYRRSKHKSVRIRNPFNLDFYFSEHKNKFIINFISEGSLWRKLASQMEKQKLY